MPIDDMIEHSGLSSQHAPWDEKNVFACYNLTL